MRYFGGVWFPDQDTAAATHTINAMSRWFAGINVASSTAALGTALSVAICRKSSEQGPIAMGKGVAHYRNVALAGDLELYNRDEIALWLLQKGIDVSQKGELALAARYINERGIEGCADFIGDFALAVFDSDAGSLSLACDHMGLRSLYWTRSGQAVLFASTPAAIRAASPGNHEPEFRSLVWHALNVSPGSNRSYLTGISRVAAGSVAVFDKAHERSRIVKYWQPQKQHREPISFSDSVERIEHEALRAIASRVPDQASVALTLSGGLDSSLLANVAARRFPGHDFHSLTAKKLEDDAEAEDETGYARLVGKAHDNITMHFLSGDDADLIAGFADAVRFQASPLRQILFFQKDALYRQANTAGAHTLLSGTGGDDAISVWGNSAYRGMLSEGRITDAWYEARLRADSAFDAAAMIVRALVGFTGLNRISLARPHAVRRQFRSIPIRAALLDDQQLVRELFESHVLPPRSIGNVHDEIVHNLQRSSQTGQYDTDLELPYLYGLEFRYPLIDWRLLESVLSLNSRCFTDSGNRRRLMRSLVARSGSPDIAERAGKGVFAPSFVNKFQTQMEECEDLIRQASGNPDWERLFDQSRLASAVKPTFTWDRFDELVDRWVVPAQIAEFLRSPSL